MIKQLVFLLALTYCMVEVHALCGVGEGMDGECKPLAQVKVGYCTYKMFVNVYFVCDSGVVPV